MEGTAWASPDMKLHISQWEISDIDFVIQFLARWHVRYFPRKKNNVLSIKWLQQLLHTEQLVWKK